MMQAYSTHEIIAGLSLLPKPFPVKRNEKAQGIQDGRKIPKNERHQHLKSKVLPKLRNAGLRGEPLFQAAWAVVQNNYELTSDFDEKEVRSVCQWFDRKESAALSEDESASDQAGQAKKPNRFKMLVQLLEEAGVEYFHDQFQNPWVCVAIDNHHENIKIKSQRFKTYLTKLFYEATKEGCGRETLQQVQDLCSAKSLFQGPQRSLSYRGAWSENRILIDLGTPEWSAIEVSASGWRMVKPKRPPFRRFGHMQSLPAPESGGRVQDILSILPIRDRTSQVLTCAWLPTAFIPDLPRPGLVLSGLQGSGKTFTTERLRLLIDPSQTLTLSLSKDQTELIQALDHHYLPTFDNLDSLPKWASDVLCRSVTGAGFTKRELYSDDDDFSYSFFRPYILNGISVCATRPDLLDRSLIIELDRISEKERKSLKTLSSAFKRLQPRVLGAMLDALVFAMQTKDKIALPELPRLADWCEWAVPVAEHLGIGKEAFLEAFDKSIKRQHSEVNNSEPAAVAILDFMSNQSGWTGTPSVLYAELSKKAEELKLDREKSWPKAPNALTRKLKAIGHNLASEGIEIKDERVGHGRARQIMIRKIEVHPAEPPEKSSAPSASQESSNVSKLLRTKTAADMDGGAITDADRNSLLVNPQESLPLDDTDDEDDIPGYPAGNAEDLEDPPF